ncbi:MarR family winged helix-turn-helix transcriptional regulator [Chitinophaga sancti]|uniref:HTH-type transcriptional regulator SarZ n=1 Tax=Chitinophaga sancti TaxID=1004 RepID=A0A1K1SNK0_9BACT|nr:MarR family transcriptional regulator [Chitinophaga sancti]WQD60060.1 MarR family transcriptional regulator [Chitinophaga sancti]WQG87811.1 MarR family transcriptional regulator [Chitinophaga sancti]SFW85796.1 DNA-binding transcriptional regulator, MarR family [Chitinophaga sancti]
MSSKNKFSALFLENQICFPLYAASRLTIKIYEPFLDKLGITYTQYLVLLVLWQKNNLTVKEIGSILYLESNTLTPLLKRLEQKELLSRVRSEEDERKVFISLTRKGEAFKNIAVEIPQQIIESFSDDAFSMEEAMQFQKQLFMLIQILDKKLQLTANLK